MNSINDEHFKTIRKAIENNKLAVFIGSGVSFDSKLPSWSDLIKEMKSSLEVKREENFLKIAEHYYIQYGQHTYFNKINDFFPANSQPNKLHDFILSLKPQHLITTNWDDLLEKAINKRCDMYFKVATDHELASSPSSQLLIKMHGDLFHRNIVFKESDYLSYSDNFPLIENFVKSLFSTHIVLFIGYSISDYNLNQIISWIKNRTEDAPPSFTILTDDKITLSEHNYLKSKGIYPILTDENKIEIEGANLSEKSKKIAKILEQIVNPKTIEITNIIYDISIDIEDWKIVYPPKLILLLRDRLNITEMDKIYYDSELDFIIYRLSDEERAYNRKTYREIRKYLRTILRKLPIKKICFKFSETSCMFINNNNTIAFVDEYTQFDFCKIIKRTNINLSSDVDSNFQYAFDNYYLKKLDISRDAFLYVANDYFSKSRFIKSLISSFNKKYVFFGEIPINYITISPKIIMEEQLSRNDNIAEIIEKFPKSIIARQKALFHGLDSNNTFLLQCFEIISHLNREINLEVDNIKKGGLVYSKKLSSIAHYIYCILLFVIKNQIAILYSSAFKNISILAFEAIAKKQSIKNNIELNEVTCFLAIFSYNERHLVDFLSDVLGKDTSINISSTTFEYILNILNNLLATFSTSENLGIGLKAHCIKIWSNTLTILSYVELNDDSTNKLYKCLINSLDTPQWFNLSESINRFIVYQVNRYRNSPSVEHLVILCERQIEKLNQSNNISIKEDGSLFANLIHLIKESNTEGSKNLQLFASKNGKEIEIFILKVSEMQLNQRLRVINNFVFVIYMLIDDVNLKEKIKKLLIDTYNEIKRDDGFEKIYIYGLVLYDLKLLEKDELTSLLERLEKKCSEDIKKGILSSTYMSIKEQLLRLPEDILNDYKELIENVIKLSDRTEKFFNLKE